MIGKEETVESPETKVPVQRLCNEIQLFDLCDRVSCSYKDGRFCTNSELVEAFERISDAEIVRQEARISEDEEDGEESYDDECDDSFDYELGDKDGFDDDY